MVAPVKMVSMNLSANASQDLKDDDVNRRVTFAKPILVSMVENVEPILTPTPVSAQRASLERTVKSILMIAN